MKFYGELLVFILLFITNFRVFFVRTARHDPLVVLAPFTFLIAILQIFAFGIEVFTILGIFVALLVLLSNFHAIFRYSENLYIDHYSPLMMIWAVVTSILSLGAIVSIIIFAPLELNNHDLKIIETKTRLQGSFRTGFEPAHFYSKADAFLYEFKSYDEEHADDDRILIFIPDKRGDTEHYKPYLQLLAQKGFTVYSADFFADDCKWLHSIEDMKILRRTAMIVHDTLKPEFFASQREFYTYNISQEIGALLSLLAEKYGDDTSFYFVSDVMGNTAIADLSIKQSSRVRGMFFLDSVPEYETAGYGFVSQTDPLFAFFKEAGRDFNFSQAKLLAEKTENLFPLETVQELETDEQNDGSGNGPLEGDL